jgi:hypothetical protein
MLTSPKNYNKLLHSNEEEFEKILAYSRDISWKNLGRKIIFYAPSFIHYETDYFCSSPSAFPSISITGSYCAIKCKHCAGKILDTMIPATTPEELIEVCTTIKNKGGIGCLISGGCIPSGSVPLDKFINAIAEIKRKLGLTIVVHTGIINLTTARKLKKAGVDAALIDIIGSDKTIQEIYHLNVKVEDYDKSLMALHQSNLPFIPHVVVGLHYGKLKGELQALRIISKYDPPALIVVALMPIDGTPMQNVKPPSPKEIARILMAARFMLPTTPIVLGCARPKGEHKVKTDMLAIKAGVTAIAFPTDEAIQFAESIGLKIIFSPLCCSQIFNQIKVLS